MGFPFDELKQQYITCHHPGGAIGITHFVNNKPYCLEPLKAEGKDDQYCSQEAGFGTDHPRTGSCRFHWGTLPSAMYNNYGKYLKRDMRERYLEFAQQDEITALNLRPELDMLRTLLTSTMDAYQETGSARAMDLVLRILDNISTTTDRIDRIQSRQILTAAMGKLIMSRAIQTAAMFIPQESLMAFMSVWEAEVASLIKTNEREVIDITPARLGDGR